ncbi:MAG: D-tyrosyl-tRNA(Tyr) deacylase [Flavobacteriales bacterium]|nr:D-tyrosyl-tRNA(Tyr) deacylase [Flavobacteriales bacterium]MBG65960.1 D-tyrosyl-tRNA(Tyr) deacylase [Flavobacteriales bacterium]|tara:strand:- start:710 stop:1162 length:453 start_codon:yes stop_codon:yes gene_type:complete
MRIVIQRVLNSSVSINNKLHAEIKNGMLIFVGIEHEDTTNDVNWLVNKILSLRIFADSKNMMNKSIFDINGQILVISQFTLHAKTKKGSRPSYIKAAKPKVAIPLYNNFLDELSKNLEGKVFSGKFGTDMQVRLNNDGPVTILIDSKNRE